MKSEKLDEARRDQLVKKRLDYLFRSAWYSICQERGYRYDRLLCTASHGTIAILSYLSATGV